MNKKQLYKDRKLRIGFLLVGIFTLFCAQNSVAQDLPFVDEIQFQHTESHRISFPKGTTFEDIHAYDMPTLEYKEMSYQMSRSIDEAGNPQTLRTLRGAENFHEDWQRLAERWLFNQEGTTLYGVRGKGRDKSYYKMDAFDHSKKGKEWYENSKVQINKFGYLTSLVFPSRIRGILNGNTPSIEGTTPYSIAPDGSLVLTNTGGEYIIYQEIDNGNGSIGIIKQIKYQENPDVSVFPEFPNENDPSVVSVTISIFDIEICDELFLSSTTEVVKDVLFNGLCAKRITENIYSDYEFECQQIAARSSMSEGNVVGDMNLSPNPLRSDLLNIKLPLSLDDEEVQIEILDLRGQSIGKIRQRVKGDIIQLHVGDLIAVQGIYIISVQSSSYTNTKKIYYTKN